jgi:hypothetical protein
MARGIEPYYQYIRSGSLQGAGRGVAIDDRHKRRITLPDVLGASDQGRCEVEQFSIATDALRLGLHCLIGPL